jgi:uncharacterized protein (TIGR00106 family)
VIGKRGKNSISFSLSSFLSYFLFSTFVADHPSQKMSHIANVALQVLPKAPGKDIYSIVDKAIEVIQKSGLKYKVCPFETVMEGPYEEILTVMENVQQAVFNAGAEEVLVYVKIQRRANADVFMEEKIGKYE